MDRRAMRGLEGGGDLDNVADLCREVWAHRHHHVALEAAGGTAGDGGFIHGDVFAFLDVADGETGLQQSFIKGEGATEEKGYGVVLPIVANVGDFVEKFSVLPYCARRGGNDWSDAEQRYSSSFYSTLLLAC